MIPWHLYQLTARDQGSPNIRPYNERQDTAAVTVVSASHTYTIPDDYYLLVSHITLSIDSATAPCSDCRWQAINYDLGTRLVAYGGATPRSLTSVAMFHEITGSPILLLPDKAEITTIGNVAGAANFNFVSNVSGILIPRGTLTLS